MFEPGARGQRKVDAADADRSGARDGLEIGEQPGETVAAERAIEQEHRAERTKTSVGWPASASTNDTLDRRRRAASSRAAETSAGWTSTPIAGAPVKRVHQRGGASHAGADVDEQIGRAHGRVLRQAQQGIDGTGQVRHAADRELGAILGGSAEAEDLIDPGVARDRLERV